MKLQASAWPKAITFIIISFLFSTSLSAQKAWKIDWSKDTISRTDVEGAKNTYLNTIRGSGQRNATQQINLPVDKLKEIMDACSTYGTSEISMIIVTIRQSDIAHYRKNNPTSDVSDNDIKGSQMLVIKVPRGAFSAQSGAKITNPGTTALSVSLLSAGLIQLKESYKELPFASGSLYFSFGSICPPPTSCDTLD